MDTQKDESNSILDIENDLNDQYQKDSVDQIHLVQDAEVGTESVQEIETDQTDEIDRVGDIQIKDLEVEVEDTFDTFDSEELGTLDIQFDEQPEADQQIPAQFVQIVFISITEDEPNVNVCIDSAFASCSDPIITPVIIEFEVNSSHPVCAFQTGYNDFCFMVQVGNEPMDVIIDLEQTTHADICPWMTGNYTYDGGSVGPFDDIFVVVQVASDHCLVCGLEPPAFAGMCLMAVYRPLTEDFIIHCLPNDDACPNVKCDIIPWPGIIECTYDDESGIEQTISWLQDLF